MRNPTINPGIYPDEYLNYWGEAYLANPEIRERGVLFITFLQHPDAILRAVKTDPLLPLQRAVQRELDRCCCRNGTLTEKLRHRRWPRHAARRDNENIL